MQNIYHILPLCKGERMGDKNVNICTPICINKYWKKEMLKRKCLLVVWMSVGTGLVRDGSVKETSQLIPFCII